MSSTGGSGVLKEEMRGQGRIDEEELRQNKKREIKYLGTELEKGNLQIICLHRTK